MFTEFITQLSRRFIKIVFSYISWQTNEIFFNPSFSILLVLCFSVLSLSIIL